MTTQRLCLFIIGLLLSISSAFAEPTALLKKERQLFQQASDALSAKNIPRFQQLRGQLDHYALAPYLDYLYLLQRLDKTSAKTIQAFLNEQNDTFYAERLRTAWLHKLAKEKRWKDYVTFYQAPQSDELTCYYLQALIHTGKQQQAFAATKEMWLVPKSQHAACDPVFARWDKAGHLSEDLRQQRLLLALRAQQFSLASYLAKHSRAAATNSQLVTSWQAMHNNPSLQLKRVIDGGEKALGVADAALAHEIVLYGFSRLANRSPIQAYSRWQSITKKVDFSADEITQIRSDIGLWAALNRDENSLRYFGDIAGGEWHIRAALWQQDWETAIRVIKQLSPEERNTPRWQYWLGRSLIALGNKKQGEITLNGILGQRDYYSFLAADLLNKPYQMNNHPIPASADELTAFQQQPAIQRLFEFYQQDMMLEANRTAYYLQQTRSARDLQLAAILAHEWGWHNQAIALLGKAQYWDDVDIRFPVIYDKTLTAAGKTNKIDASWLLAIARQESAFNSNAQSHVGAMGLMQLMPETARMIAKQINYTLTNLSELYQPQTNITLGSAYLRHVYEDNQHNPVLATAAYNAGPHRVNRWLPKKKLDADIWAENIPFQETRSYVQNVMTYAAIFDSQRQLTVKPISQRMPAIQPKKL